MRSAVIDLGTNTAILLIAEKKQDQWVPLLDKALYVRFGQGLKQTGKLDSQAIERCFKVLDEFRQDCERHQVSPSSVTAVLTAPGRQAQDIAPWIEQVQKKFGFHFRVITGEQESEWSYQGAAEKTPISAQSVGVLDIGGGSTETRDATHGSSISWGSVWLKETFFHSDPVTDQQFWAARKELDEAFAKTQKISADRWVGVAGSIVSLGQLFLVCDYDAAKIHGTCLTTGDLHRLTEELKWRTVTEIQAMKGMDSKRADVILAGALIAWRAAEYHQMKKIEVSCRGLRYALLDGLKP